MLRRIPSAFGNHPYHADIVERILKRARPTEVTDSPAEVVKELHEFFATVLSQVLIGMVQSGTKRVNAAQWNRGVNAIVHAGTGMGTVKNYGAYLLHFQWLRTPGGQHEVGW
jgi:hypothetical protein